MEQKRFKPNSSFLLNQCATTTRLRDGVDRISELPDEIVAVILSFLSLREAATTSVLSSRWLHLWKLTPNLKSDRISRLPHSIIVDILSKLPLKAAAATSVLCSRWLHLWKHTTNLDFTTSIFKFSSYRIMMMDVHGSWNADKCKYVKLVNSVIQSHKAPSLKQFTISFHVTKSAKCVVAKWLGFAFSRGVERLVLDFNCRNPEHTIVLEEVLRESGLCSSPQTRILFKSLQRLCLKHAIVSGRAVQIFLLNCPSLEELIISDSTVMYDVGVCGATLVLKHLEVYDCSSLRSLRVSAPNLTRLKFKVVNGSLHLGSIPKLVEAEFLCFSRTTELLQNTASALFRLSSQLEILKLTIRFPKLFLANEFAEMPKLRKLVVEYYGMKTHRVVPVTALLWASPNLQEFKLKFKEMRRFRNGDDATEVRGNGERSGHLHLKLFELEGLVDGADDHIELVTYILDNCVGLEKIQISVARSPPDGPAKEHSHLLYEQAVIQAAIDYAGQCLQPRLPQHVQLQLS